MQKLASNWTKQMDFYVMLIFYFIFLYNCLEEGLGNLFGPKNPLKQHHLWRCCCIDNTNVCVGGLYLDIHSCGKPSPIVLPEPLRSDLGWGTDYVSLAGISYAFCLLLQYCLQQCCECLVPWAEIWLWVPSKMACCAMFSCWRRLVCLWFRQHDAVEISI